MQRSSLKQQYILACREEFFNTLKINFKEHTVFVYLTKYTSYNDEGYDEGELGVWCCGVAGSRFEEFLSLIYEINSGIREMPEYYEKTDEATFFRYLIERDDPPTGLVEDKLSNRFIDLLYDFGSNDFIDGFKEPKLDSYLLVFRSTENLHKEETIDLDNITYYVR